MATIRMPPLPPVSGRGLVIPGAGAPGSPALTLAYARYLALSLERFQSIGEELPPSLRATYRRTCAALERAFPRNQKAVLACFAAPGVGTPLHCMNLRGALPGFEDRIDRGARSLLPHLLLELAARRLLDGNEAIEVSIPVEDGAPWELASPTLGVSLRPPAGADALRFESGRIVALAGGTERATLPLDADPRTARDTGFEITPRYRRVGGVTRLALVDHNPIAAFEAHPDKEGNHVDLGDRSEDEWARVLEEAFGLIKGHCPDIHAEMSMLLHELVPVGYHAQRHLSASYREAIGTVYLTLHDNVMTMAEALIHEFQHNKANVAACSTDFIVNAYYPHYPSPVRPDPRPLWGILLAVHAFLPVAVLYRRMRAAGHPRALTHDFERRLADIDLKNHEGMEMLRAHAEWTRAGRVLMDELEALDRAHMGERASRGMAVKPTEAHLA